MSCTLFTRRACPACPPVREFCESRFEKTELIDCDSPDGLESALLMGVSSCPTAIVYADNGREIGRFCSIETMRRAERKKIFKGE